jgi:NAD(P)H-nitrite reductase large subunit
VSLKTEYAVIGAGIAGIAAAEAIREADSSSSLLLINGEAVPPYCRPLIIELLSGERTPEAIHLRSEEWYGARGISLVSGDPVTAIEPEARKLRLESGQSVHYRKLLVATGSKPAVPSIPGLDKVPAHTLYYRSDADRLRSLCRQGRRALVLGIGLIGLQAITALRELGVDVTAVEMKDRVLPLILDRETAALACERMRAKGVEIYLGTAVKEIETGGGPPFRAVTDGGNTISFDFAVVATGVKPQISLLNSAGIRTAGGVKVSPAMETSAQEIYAAGDVTEYPDHITGRDEIHAHWVNAYHQGRAAGLAMTGSTAESFRPFYLNSLDVFGLPIVTLGMSHIDAPPSAQVLIDNTTRREACTRLVIRDGRIVAATFVNDIDRAGIFHYLMRENIDVGEVSRSLFAWETEGMNFLCNLHSKTTKGTVPWPESMDRIKKYQKDLNRTRWGSEKR